jgi:hypothetical protein
LAIDEYVRGKRSQSMNYKSSTCFIGITLAVFVMLRYPSPARSSILSADAIQVSTIAGQTNSNGIVFSSDVFIAAGSSLTLQGSGGYITSQSSITAAAFFGDGSALTGIATLSSTQTWSKSNIFNSSFTIQSGARQIVISTSVSVRNILIDVNGATSFFPELHNTTSTIDPIPENWTRTRFKKLLV